MSGSIFAGRPLGVNDRWVVNLIEDPSPNGKMVWIVPIPSVGVPTTITLFQSCHAATTISAPDAVPELTRATAGMSTHLGDTLLNHSSFLPARFLVYITSLSLSNSCSATRIASFRV